MLVNTYLFAAGVGSTTLNYMTGDYPNDRISSGIRYRDPGILVAVPERTTRVATYGTQGGQALANNAYPNVWMR